MRNEDAVEAVLRVVGPKGADYIVECAGTGQAINEAGKMISRGGKICLAAFPHGLTEIDLGQLVMNNVYLYGIRGEGKSGTHRAAALMAEKRFDATLIHTHTFPLDELPTAIRYARDRVEDAIKVVVRPHPASQG